MHNKATFMTYLSKFSLYYEFHITTASKKKRYERVRELEKLKEHLRKICFRTAQRSVVT